MTLGVAHSQPSTPTFWLCSPLGPAVMSVQPVEGEEAEKHAEQAKGTRTEGEGAHGQLKGMEDEGTEAREGITDR